MIYILCSKKIGNKKIEGSPLILEANTVKEILSLKKSKFVQNRAHFIYISCTVLFLVVCLQRSISSNFVCQAKSQQRTKFGKKRRSISSTFKTPNFKLTFLIKNFAVKQAVGTKKRVCILFSQKDADENDPGQNMLKVVLKSLVILL